MVSPGCSSVLSPLAATPTPAHGAHWSVDGPHGAVRGIRRAGELEERAANFAGTMGRDASIWTQLHARGLGSLALPCVAFASARGTFQRETSGGEQAAWWRPKQTQQRRQQQRGGVTHPPTGPTHTHVCPGGPRTERRRSVLARALHVHGLRRRHTQLRAPPPVLSFIFLVLHFSSPFNFLGISFQLHNNQLIHCLISHLRPTRVAH